MYKLKQSQLLKGLKKLSKRNIIISGLPAHVEHARRYELNYPLAARRVYVLNGKKGSYSQIHSNFLKSNVIL